MESVDFKGEVKKSESKFNEEIHTEIVRAGKRTYFFDVKSTRNDEYYLTITESKKRFNENGKFHFEKHKLFLYKEDFDKFADSLQDAVNYIRKNQPQQDNVPKVEKIEEKVEVVAEPAKDFSDIEFEDI
ncbi:MAG: DUF3276 family protein [Draconibacterium sp.]|nr:DUF3276 family protein [Draconibacterium sp.]